MSATCPFCHEWLEKRIAGFLGGGDDKVCEVCRDFVNAVKKKQSYILFFLLQFLFLIADFVLWSEHTQAGPYVCLDFAY